MSYPFKHPVRSVIGFTAMGLSLIAFFVLLFRAITLGSAWHIISFSIYGLSLVTVWTISTLYHTLRVSPPVNRTLDQLDHAMIYFLIAGTYTPMCLVALRGAWGWSLLGVNWSLAIAGIVLKLVFRYPSRGVTGLLFTFYILMGWLIILAWKPLAHVMPAAGLHWLVWGGVCYTVGAIIFNLRHVPFHPRFGAHEIWHVFVASGCFCHFWSISQYVILLK